MNCWNNWLALNEENVQSISAEARGVCAIRIVSPPKHDVISDIIFIGCSGIRNNQCVRKRLLNLLKGLDMEDDITAKEVYHQAAPCIRKHKKRHDVEFSLNEYQTPDEVKEAKRECLLEFLSMMKRLPVCNRRL